MKSKRMNSAILAGFPCSHRKYIWFYNSGLSSNIGHSILHGNIFCVANTAFIRTMRIFLWYLYSNIHWFINTFLQALFNDQSLESSEKIIATTHTAIYPEEAETFEKPYTLEEFSVDHFLPPPKRTLSKALQSQVKRRDKNIPWAFTKVLSVHQTSFNS